MPPTATRGKSRRGRSKQEAYRRKVESLLPDQFRIHICLIVIAALHVLVSGLLAGANSVLGGSDGNIDQSRSRYSISTEYNLAIVTITFSCAALIAILLMVWRYRVMRNQVLSDLGASHPLPPWMNNRDFRPSEALHKPDGQKRRRRNSVSRTENSTTGAEETSVSEADQTDDDEPEDAVDPLYAKMTVPFHQRSMLWISFNLYPGTGPNIADLFYIVCLGTMAAGLAFPNTYTTPMNVIGCMLCLLFLLRPLVTRQAMLPTRPLPLGITPMASSMDKLVTPATVYISPTAFVDIDRFLATADARQRTYLRAGLTVSQMALGSFLSIAIVMICVGIVAFVVLQMQFVGKRASFYPSTRLTSMGEIAHVATYWPLQDAQPLQAAISTMSERLSEIERTAEASGRPLATDPFTTQAVLQEIGLYKKSALGDAPFVPAFAGASPREVLKTLSAASDVPRLQRLSKKRVLFVVLDGLRFDFLERNADFRELLADNSFRKDAKVLKMTGQLPSMSVPNWLTLVTGSPPEITGVLGNLNVPETRYDSIFSRAGLFDPVFDIDSFNETAASMLSTAPLQRGLTGSPWFGDILRNHLPELQGIGTVDVAYVPPYVDRSDIKTGIFADHDTITADYSDWRRAAIAVQALSQLENPYTLFLAHFSDIDQQGHCCGVEPKYNHKNSYDGAVSNKTIILRALIDAVNRHPLANDTVVVITSDHGHLAPGGHGGVAPVLTKLPLIFYSPNSNLGFSTGAAPDGSRFPVLDGDDLVDNPYEAQTQEISSTSVAPTITAILGIPAPRQAVGLLINDALPLLDPTTASEVMRDHFEQKKQLLLAFLAQSGAQAGNYIYDDPVLADTYNPLQTTQGYIDGATRIRVLYDQRRDDTFTASLLRNFYIALATVLCLTLAGLISLEARSVVFMRSLVVYRYAVCCCLFNKKEEEEENERTGTYSTLASGQISQTGTADMSLGMARIAAMRHDYGGAAAKRRAAGVDISEFQYRQTAGLLRTKPITGEKNVNERGLTGQDIARRRYSVNMSRNSAPGVSSGGRARSGSFSTSHMRPSVSYGVVPNRTQAADGRGSVMMVPLGSPAPPGASSSQWTADSPARPSFAGQGFRGQQTAQSRPQASFGGPGPLPPPQPPMSPGSPTDDGEAEEGAYRPAPLHADRSFDYRSADLSRYGERAGPGGVSNAGASNVLPMDIDPAAQAGGGGSTVLGLRTIRKKKKRVAKPLSVTGDGVNPPGWAENAGVGGVPIKPHAATSQKQATTVEVQIINDEDQQTDLNMEPPPEPEPEQEPSAESDEEDQGLAMPTQISSYDPSARDWKRYHDEIKELAMMNRRAIIISVVFTVVYIALSVGIFAGTYDNLGYRGNIDSSVLHTDLVLPRYLFLTVLVPCIVQLLLIRGLYAAFVIYVPAPEQQPEGKVQRATSFISRVWSNFGRLVCTEATSRRGLIKPASRGFLYLTTIYLLVILICVLLVLMIAQACFEFWIPTIYPVYFITADFWVTRFRVLAIELIMMPFIIMTTLLLLCLPDFHPYTDQYDSILRLYIYKERAVMLRQDPTPLNLDAELEVADRELDLLEDMRMTKVTSAREAAKINAPVVTS